MQQTALERKLVDICTPVLADAKARLVQLSFKSNVLELMVEGADGSRMGVDQFAELSRELSPVLEVEDPIPGAYRLEISSPGIDRPLITAEDFANYEGFEAKIELGIPDEKGQKRFRGVIKGEKDGIVVVETDTGDVELPVDSIAKAKLVLTDDLIKLSRAKLNLDNTQQDDYEQDDNEQKD